MGSEMCIRDSSSSDVLTGTERCRAWQVAKEGLQRRKRDEWICPAGQTHWDVVTGP